MLFLNIMIDIKQYINITVTLILEIISEYIHIKYIKLDDKMLIEQVSLDVSKKIIKEYSIICSLQDKIILLNDLLKNILNKFPEFFLYLL